MINEETLKKLNDIKRSCIVIDLETAAVYPGTNKIIDISTNFEDYIKYAKAKWFGCYSYKHDKYITDLVYGNEDHIKRFIAEHKIIIGFNNEEFDTPILYNNNLMPDEGFFKQIDMKVILGSSTYATHKGQPFKDRGKFMGYKFKNNSLRRMAETMELETQKGDIDYNIFHQNMYTKEQVQDIKKYLEADVKATKEMFDKTWEFYFPFTEFLSEKDILNLSWIKSSIASLTYKAACNTLGVEASYADKPDTPKEEMGGRVIEPKYEEQTGVWYVDFTSLYPHIFAQFNLFSEINPEDYVNLGDAEAYGKIWHGNDMFQVKGYYDISRQHPLSKDVAEKLKLRLAIKKQIKETGVANSLEYAIKIFLNSLYGAARSPVFEQIHTPNCGWDCCWLGQQIQMYTEKRMSDFGFETIAGDTDSIFVKLIDKENIEPNGCEKEYVLYCLNQIVKEIKANVPFPADTFNIAIENYLHYVMWPFEEQPVIDPETGKNKKIGSRLVKERKGLKKNYLYIYEKDGQRYLKIMGLAIKKDGATLLGPKIFKEILEPAILSSMNAKFPEVVINEHLQNYIRDPENMKLLAREYKVKPLSSYKNESQIQAQISLGYFNGQEGIISLIKNNICGKAGKTAKYCTVEEAIENNLKIEDLDLEKVENELDPFINFASREKKVKKKKIKEEIEEE